MRWTGRLIGWLGSLLVMLIVVMGLVLPAWSDTMPTVTASSGAGDVTLPDFNRVGFAGLPPVQKDGAFNDGTVNRSWQAGQTLDQIMTIGDIQNLGAQSLSIDSISSAVGQQLPKIGLNNFPLVAQQSLDSLVSAAPTLAGLKLDSIPAVKQLLGDRAAGLISSNLLNSDSSLGQLLKQVPKLGNLQLNATDLSKFAINSIPGLSQLPLSNLPGWQGATLDKVPGLGQVPLAAFPNPVAAVLGGVAMRIDFVWGPKEGERKRTISGSDKMGFKVPCFKDRYDCAAIELHPIPKSGPDDPLIGVQWVSGKYQTVEGGSGPLGLVNGGKEPTGRLPFGDVFKVVVWEPDETNDSVSTALFLRSCVEQLGIKTCTPYFIGPIPFLTYKRDANIWVGKIEGGGPGSTSSDATGASKGGAMPALPANALSQFPDVACAIPGAQSAALAALKSASGGKDMGTPFGASPSSFGTGALVGGVNMGTLASSIAAIESQGSGGYSAVGAFTCADGGRNCGRGLGKYQFMNYNDTAAGIIGKRSGGQAFIDKVKGGYSPNSADLMQYFPPADQDLAFQTSLSDLAGQAAKQTDPTTGASFTGDRLIERVAQMHFGGAASQVDGMQSDANGALSLKQYGDKALSAYKQGGGAMLASATGDANACSPASSDGQTCTVDSAKMSGAVNQVLGALSPVDRSGGAKMVPYILKACAKAGVSDADQLAYILATAKHETGHFRTMNEDSRYMYDKCGWGEGMIQVTWCDKKEFVFKKLGLPAYGGINDKRLSDPTIAADALCRGMKEGWYGQMRPIGECIGGGKTDYACAREQVNDGDRVQEIADYAKNIKKGLTGGSANANGAVVCTPGGGGVNGSPPPSGQINQRVMQAVSKMGSFSSKNAPGTDGGRLACAWAVNQVMGQAGIRPLGDNPLYVPSVEAALRSGRGQAVNTSQAQAGDIVIAPNQEHIGICMNAGCSQVRSNSTSNSSFTWNSDLNFGGSYGGGPSTIYRVTKP